MSTVLVSAKNEDVTLRADVKRDLQQSARDFLEVVWPAIGTSLGGEIIPVEATLDSEARDIQDMMAGIDAWQIIRGQYRMRGIASRVQPAGKSWGTFTIRYMRTSGAATEWFKRRAAVEEAERGWLFPHLTIQAYISEDRLEFLSAAAVRTRDLVSYVDRWLGKDKAKVYTQRNTADGNTFLVVPWQRLAEDCELLQWNQR